MAGCVLSERQKDLLRSIAPGVVNGTVPTIWGVTQNITGRLLITAFSRIDDEDIKNKWDNATLADFDVFVECGFFIRRREGGYSLIEQAIIEAVEANFVELVQTYKMHWLLPRLFVSYSREDTPFFRRIESKLRRAYDDVWSDQQLRGGEMWWNDILHHIAECDCFLYLLSTYSLQSLYCRAEFAEAMRLRKRIIPIRIARSVHIPNFIEEYHVRRQTKSDTRGRKIRETSSPFLP